MLSAAAFAIVGFMLMFGPSVFGAIGASWEFLALTTLDDKTMIFFVFQAAFCGAAATIFSGAVAEQDAAINAATGEIARITESVESNAQRAGETLENAQAVTRQAGASEAAIAESVSAMRRIREQSTRIAAVVEMIEEVAAKTNMLAINAAVEAARAGHHGKSFSIVADEVRELASTTQGMAVEISQKVKATSAAVDEGVRTVSIATDALAVIRHSAESAAASMTEIQQATRNQAEQTQTLMLSIDAIATLGAGNRELAESGAAAASEIADETDRLSNAAHHGAATRAAQTSTTQSGSPQAAGAR